MSISTFLKLNPLARKAGLTVLAILFSGYANGAAEDPYAEPENPGLPPSNMELNLPRTALVITDPQIDFLSPDGVTWALVGNSVTSNKTVENIERLLKTAKQQEIAVFVSPHYYFPTDHGWKFEGALEKVIGRRIAIANMCRQTVIGFGKISYMVTKGVNFAVDRTMDKPDRADTATTLAVGDKLL